MTENPEWLWAHQKSHRVRKRPFPDFVNSSTNCSFTYISIFPQVLVPNLTNSAFTTIPARHAHVFSKVSDPHTQLRARPTLHKYIFPSISLNSYSLQEMSAKYFLQKSPALLPYIVDNLLSPSVAIVRSPK